MAFSEQIPEHVGAYSCEDAVRRFRIRVSHPVETAQTISYHPNFMPVNRVNHRTGRHTVLRMACGLFVYPVHFVIMPDGRSEASCRRGCIGIFWKTGYGCTKHFHGHSSGTFSVHTECPFTGRTVDNRKKVTTFRYSVFA
jgi:hypothetical protein